MRRSIKRKGVFSLFLLSALFFFVGVIFVLRGQETAEASAAVTADTLPASLNDLFTDYTRTKLNEAYDTMEELDALRKKAGTGNEAVFTRAEDVIKGKVAFEPDREFSTKPTQGNKIEQYGDVSGYSTASLNFGFCASDLMITGIYGMTGETITVYVEADAGANLPYLVITQNHGYYSTWRERINLSRGRNTFSYSDLSRGTSQKIKGGAIYIVNPYTSSSQGGQVSLYIEGGGFYPAYRLGEDEQRFLDVLEEYETMRKNHSTTMLDMAEIESDHALFTLESSTLYQVYFEKKSITPSENLELWEDYFKRSLEFNGIATSPSSPNGHYDERNDHIKVNIRMMSQYLNSGAYSYYYHIGLYDQNEWLANYRFVEKAPSAKYVFDVGHELGHVLDVPERVLHETTNNVNAAYAYADILGRTTIQFFPFEKAIEYMGSDYTLKKNAFDDGYILYTESNNYDHNYLVWWYLESVFPGYWAKLNNMYRYDDTFYSPNSVEKMVYYSSLVTGVDLSEYFDRWGVYLMKGANFSKDAASSAFREAMDTAIRENKISSNAGHYWYVDVSEYDFMRKHSSDSNRSYAGDEPVITSITERDGKRTISIGGKPDPNLLGYEILSKTDGGEYRIAGFTYLTSFLDENTYSSTPTYKVVAINRFFSSKESKEASRTNGTPETSGVCRVDGKNYPTLTDGIEAVKKDHSKNVVELLSDCSIGGMSLYVEITLKVADGVNHDITITCTGKSYMFNGNSKFKLEGREGARIVLSGGASSAVYPVIFAASGTFSAEYVTFRSCKSGMYGGAIYSLYAEVNLKNCNFENCSSGGNSDAIYMGNKVLTMENCSFTGQNVDLYFNATPDLTLVGGVPKMTIGMKEPGAVKIKTDGFIPKDEDCKKLSFVDPSLSVKLNGESLEIGGIAFQLTFKDGNQSAVYEAKSTRFTFGEETISFLQDEKYCASYQDRSGKTYKPGETIELSGDMEFTVTLANKNKLTLCFMENNEEEIDFIGERGVYLPRFDGDNKIVFWVSNSASYFAGEMFHASGDETLTAVYLDRFLYRYMDHGKCVSYGYAEYGESVSVNANHGTNFRGWFTEGKIVTGNISITKNTLLTAIYDGDSFDLTKAKITVSDCVYTGSPQRPEIVVELNGCILSEDFYTVEYLDNVKAGTAKVRIAPRGEVVVNSKEQTFQIQKTLPFTRPSETIRVGSSVETVKGVSLPEGWSWKNTDQKLAMGENKAIAVYFDEENFTQTEMEITIVRGEGAGGGSSSEQTPQEPQEPQGPQEEPEEPEAPEEPEGETPDKNPEEGNKPNDPENKPDPEEPEQKPDEKEPEEQNPGDSANSGSRPGDSADSGNHAGTDSGTVDQGGNGALLWLLVIPGVLIPVGVVLIIILKKRKNG